MDKVYKEQVLEIISLLGNALNAVSKQYILSKQIHLSLVTSISINKHLVAFLI